MAEEEGGGVVCEDCLRWQSGEEERMVREIAWLEGVLAGEGGEVEEGRNDEEEGSE